MRAEQLYAELEKLIPRELSCDWDNDGLMAASYTDKPVERVLLTLDVTMPAVEYAIENSCDVIISHHPLIFRPLKGLRDEKLLRIVKNEIAVMSFHTRLDIVQGGVNDELAALLGLENVAQYGEGELARIGDLKENMSFDEYAEFVRKTLGAPYVNVIKCREEVGRVMAAGGDGKDFYADAVSSGAGTYITGAMSYNTLVDAAENPAKVNVIEAGHYFTEQPVLNALERMVKNIIPEAEIRTYEANPVKTIGVNIK